MKQAVERLARRWVAVRRVLGERPGETMEERGPHEGVSPLPGEHSLVSRTEALLWLGCPEVKWVGTRHTGLTRSERLSPTLLLRMEGRLGNVGGSPIPRLKSHQAR